MLHVGPITCVREDATEPWSPVFTVIRMDRWGMECRNRIKLVKSSFKKK